MVKNEEQREPFLRMWSVYEHPTDYPDKYVARLWHNDQPQDSIVITPTLALLRDLLMQMGLVRLTRHDTDEPHIVETWI